MSLARKNAHVEQLLQDQRVLQDDIDDEVYRSRSPTRSVRAQNMAKEAERLYYEINLAQEEVKALSAQADAESQKTALGQLRTMIQDWEYSWVEMLPRQNNPKRAEMVAEIRKIGELHATDEISRWIQAFESSLVEQAKYEARYEKLSDTSTRNEALQTRATSPQAYSDNGQLQRPPDWLLRHLHPRHGPAHSPIIAT